ncbi:MAG: hypothetical protein IJO78_01920 [Erysipelotrichaceae bacterium]|nr:hypothetical protein [Erysipelotrichaceae bacterium]
MYKYSKALLKYLLFKENSPKKNTEGSYSVNWNNVQPQNLRKRLKSIFLDDKVVSSIIIRCIWALDNRDGLRSEEIYAINLENGREIGRIANQYLDFGVIRDDTFEKKLKDADNRNINYLLIHNHPRGLPPSISDINALLNNSNASGITIGHNGTMYYYTKPNREIDVEELDIALKHFSMYTEATGIEKALELLSKRYGFVFKKL